MKSIKLLITIILLSATLTCGAQVKNKDISIGIKDNGNITLAVDNHKAYVVINLLNYNSFISAFDKAINRYDDVRLYEDDIIIKRIKFCNGGFEWFGNFYDGYSMKIEFKLHKPMRQHGNLYLTIYDGAAYNNMFIECEPYVSFLTKEDAIEVRDYIIKLHDNK